MRSTLLIAAVIAAPAAAQGRPDFEYRKALAEGNRVYVQNVIGDVHVLQGSGRALEATGTRREGRHGRAEDVEIRTIDLPDGVAICVVYPRRWAEPPDGSNPKEPCSHRERWQGRNWHNDEEGNDTRVTLTIRVPAGVRIDAGTVSGDVDGTDLSGDITLRSVSGDVALTGGDGPQITLETVSGNVDLRKIRAKDVSGRTISGEVLFEGPILSGGSYDFATTSGDVTIALPGRPDATLSAATFSGGFSSDLPVNQDGSRHRRHRYDATWGSGSAKLYMESLSGDLTIRVARE